VLFRRRAKLSPPAPPSAPVTAVASAPEDGARELVLAIMAAAPDLRHGCARDLGLLAPGEGGGGPEFERMLLERALERRMLGALEQAIPR
jgi:hypothetical protein